MGIYSNEFTAVLAKKQKAFKQRVLEYFINI
jgi:hypothetical protein